MNDLKFNADGVIPAIVRDARTGAVLTLAYMNEESLRRTLDSGETWFFSRSRQSLWHKGETSGHTQRVVSIAPDCDRDTLLVSVEPAGPACHTGSSSCFPAPPGRPLERLMTVLADRRATRPADSYSAYLFDEGRDKILKKVGEEATEVVIAGKGDSRERLVSEVADLVYHLSVLLVDAGVGWEDVEGELGRRAEPEVR